MSIYEAQWEPSAECDSIDFYDHGNVCDWGYSVHVHENTQN